MGDHFYQERVNRETGTLIIVGHGADIALDWETDGPWYTICEDHALLCSHPTLALARDHAAQPSGWCEGCRDWEARAKR